MKTAHDLKVIFNDFKRKKISSHSLIHESSMGIIYVIPKLVSGAALGYERLRQPDGSERIIDLI